MKKILAFFLVVLGMSVLFSQIFACSIVYPFAGISVVSFMVSQAPAGQLSILAFTAPGGVGAAFAFQLKFLPEFLIWDNANPLTSLQISTKEEGIIQTLTAAEMVIISDYMSVFNGFNSNAIGTIRLATGEINPKDVTISGVTAGAGITPFFVNSDNNDKSARPFRLSQSTILALTPTIFENFTAIFLEGTGAGDSVNVEFSSGFRQVYAVEELLYLSAVYQRSDELIINNINSYIKRVYVTSIAGCVANILSVIL